MQNSRLEDQQSARSRAVESEEQLRTLNSQMILLRSELDALRATITLRDQELVTARTALSEAQLAAAVKPPPPSAVSASDLAAVVGRSKQLEEDLAEANTKRADSEKEQEDLLVLLEELSAKRKADKGKMRTAGLDVSDDEDEGDDEDE